MKKELLIGLMAVGLLIIGTVKFSYSTIINSNFSDYQGFVYSNTASRSKIDDQARSWYKTYYGIAISHAYFYTDPRDPFDGMGISNGWLWETWKTNVSGIIKFTKKTDFVSVDAISLGQNVVFSVYDKKNRLIDSQVAPINGAYSLELNGKNISYLTFTSLGGYVSLSNLSYNYQGSLPAVPISTSPVPEPTTILLFAVGLTGLAALSRKKCVS